MLHRLLILTFFCFTLLIVIFGNVHESNAQAGITVSFNDLTPGDSVNGEYPAGVINWGTDRWSVNPPFGGFTTNNIAFTNFVTNLSFTFVTPRTLVRIDAYNDGGGANSTVTISCAGNPTVTRVVAIGALATIATGWTTLCTTVTIGSSNRWDTSFDTFVVQSGTPTATPTPTALGTPTPTTTTTPTPVPSWMQVGRGGNVYSRGRITMPIAPPTPNDYNVNGGVVTQSDPVDPNFRVQNDWLLPNYIPSTYPYDYDYFHNRLEHKSIMSTTEIAESEVYEIMGPLVVSDTTPFNNKNIVLFVEGDLLLNQATFNPVNGAVIFIVKGNISFDPIVATARGIFLANEKISTGASNTNAFQLTGILLSHGGINLERNLGQNTPSETIVYDPGIAIQLRNLLWKSPVAFGETVP